jgi:hypothetical protein
MERVATNGLKKIAATANALISDFCNKIGTKQTSPCRYQRLLSGQ